MERDYGGRDRRDMFERSRTEDSAARTHSIMGFVRVDPEDSDAQPDPAAQPHTESDQEREQRWLREDDDRRYALLLEQDRRDRIDEVERRDRVDDIDHHDRVRAELDRRDRVLAEQDRRRRTIAEVDRHQRIRDEQDRRDRIQAEVRRQYRAQAEQDRRYRLRAEVDRDDPGPSEKG